LGGQRGASETISKKCGGKHWRGWEEVAESDMQQIVGKREKLALKEITSILSCILLQIGHGGFT